MALEALEKGADGRIRYLEQDAESDPYSSRDLYLYPLNGPSLSFGTPCSIASSPSSAFSLPFFSSLFLSTLLRNVGEILVVVVVVQGFQVSE